MANVKAGVAYVDVRLGSIEQFKDRLKSEIENATKEVTKRVGDKMAKEMAPEGTKVGKTTAGALSKAFFSDANRSFTGGLRALATGQFRVFGKMMKEAGAATSLGFRNAFDSGISGIRGSFRRAGEGVKSAATSLVNSVGSAFSAIPGKAAAASKAVGDFGKRVGFVAFQLQGFGVIATAAFTAPVAAAIGFASVIGIKTAASIEQATASLKALTPAGTDVEGLIKRLQKLAQQSPIFNTTDIVTFTQKMVASGLTVQATEAFLASFGRIALTVGADVSKIPLALEALVQMVGKGKVSMEELRQQLGDALPGAMKLLADGLGITTQKLFALVSEGEIAPEQVIAAFTKLGNSGKYLTGAGDAADTLGAKWQALKESLQTQLGNAFLEHAPEIKKALDDLGPPLSDLIRLAAPLFADLVKGLTGFVTKLSELVNWYKSLSPGQQDFVNKLMLVGVILGPIVLALSGLGLIIGGLSALFAAIATPVGLVVVALIAFGVEAFLIIKYLKKLYSEGGKFKEVWDKIWKSGVELLKPLREEWDKIWPSLKDGFEQIKNAVIQVKDSFNGFGGALTVIGSVLMITFGPIVAIVFGVIKGLISAIGPLFKAITSLISGIIKIFGGLIAFLTGVFSGDWDQALKGLKTIWDGIWDAIVGTIVNLVKALWNLVKGLVTGIADFFTWLWDVLVGHSIIPDMVNAIIAWFTKMWRRGVELVKALGRPFISFYNDHIKPFVDGVKRGVDRALDFVRYLPSRIKGLFTSAGSWLIDAGRNIVNGLIDGVKRMSGTLKNAILNLIPGPVRGIVEGALGINSPSRVFMEYGKYVILGFLKGIQNLQPVLAGGVERVFSFAPPSVSPYFGDPKNPAVDPRGPGGPAVNIETYNANDADPDKIAEDLWFKIQGRGGGF